MAELRAVGTDGVPEVGRDLVVGRLGEGLRRLRGRRNLTQRQLAELATVTPAAISQAESGRRGLSLETLVILSDGRCGDQAEGPAVAFPVLPQNQIRSMAAVPSRRSFDSVWRKIRAKLRSG